MDIQWLLNLPQPIKGGAPSSTKNLVLKAGDLLTASVLEVDKGRDALLAFGQFKAYARLPLPVVTRQNIQIQVQQADQGLRLVMLPSGGGQPTPTPPENANPQIIAQQPDQGGLLRAKNDASPPATPPRNDNLQIRLFEPVSDRPFLSAHAHLLRPGDSLEGRITGFSKDGLMLVDFGTFKAFAKIDVPVREGQILPLTVDKPDQGVTLSVRASGTRQAANLPPQPPSTLTPRGVAPDLAGGNVEKGALTTPAPFQAPSTGASAYQPALPQPSVPLAPPTAPEMTQLGNLIQQLLGHPDLPQRSSGTPFPQTTQAALTHLQQLLLPVSTTGDTADLMASIKNFVENSGLYFEKRMETAIRTLQQDRPTPMTPAELAQEPPIRELMVNDLKPNLLVLKQFLESQSLDQQAADRHVLETMKSVVQRTLAHIEQQQLGATEKPVDPDLFQAFSHLLLLADHRRDARLKVYYAKKGRRDDANKTPRVALLLEMDRMGTVRTDLWMVGRDLNITFFVQTEETKAKINAVQDEIKTALKERFNTVAVSAVVNKKKIDQFDGEDISPLSQRLLDLTI